MRLLTIALAVLSLAACGGGVARLDDKQRTAKPDNAPIAVFITNKPDRAYDEIGIIKMESDARMEGMVERAKHEARQLGGDAVILRTNAGSYIEQGPVRQTGGTYSEAIIIAWKP